MQPGEHTPTCACTNERECCMDTRVTCKHILYIHTKAGDMVEELATDLRHTHTHRLLHAKEDTNKLISVSKEEEKCNDEAHEAIYYLTRFVFKCSSCSMTPTLKLSQFMETISEESP